MRVQQMTIPGTFPGYNDIVRAFARNNFTSYVMLKSKYTGIAQVHIERQLEPVEKFPIDLRFDWYVRGARDHDNVLFARKCILDGMVNAQVIPEDNPACVGNFRGDVFHADPDNPRVVITILEREDECDAADFEAFAEGYAIETEEGVV